MPSDLRPPSPSWLVPLICLGLIALVIVIYGQTLSHGFINYDDDIFVTRNAHVLGGLSWSNLKWAFEAGLSAQDQSTDYWRPISILSQMADVQLFGMHAGAHHAVNMLLHALNSALLFLFLRSMTGAIWRSAFVAALFAIHPLHVESVAWISERKDLLCGLFFLLTLGAYNRYASKPFGWGSYVLLGLLSALAMASKPMVVTLPCVLLLLDYWPLQRTLRVRWSRLFFEKTPLFVMAFAIAWVTTLGSGGVNDGAMKDLPLLWRVENAVVAYATYLYQMVWPSGLAVFYPHLGRSLPSSSFIVSLGCLTCITVAVIWQRKRRYLPVGWLWFLGTLVPVIGILQSGTQAHADRYTYLPSIGLFIMVVWLAGDWAGESRARNYKRGTFGVLWLGGLLVAAHQQTFYWRDSITLWNHTISSTGENALAQGNLGVAYLEDGDAREAEKHLREQFQIDPSSADSHYNLGYLAHQVGRTNEAVAEYHQALKIAPKHTFARLSLGFELFIQGHEEEAFGEFYHVYKPDTPRVEICLDLAEKLSNHQKDREAISVLEEALRKFPSNQLVQNNLAWLLSTNKNFSLRDGQRSLVLALKASAATGSKDPRILDTLSAAYAETGDFVKALETAQAGLKLAEASGNKELAFGLKKEIALYYEGKPFRQP